MTKRRSSVVRLGALCLAGVLLLAGGCGRSRPLSADESLRLAAEQGGMGRVQRALARRANVNSRDRWGNTALHGAALNGHVAIAQLLLGYGADINAVNDGWETPLGCAVRGRQAGTTRLLLERGASDDGSPGGLRKTLTPLLFSWQSDAEVTELLIAYGADVNGQSRDGETPLHFAATHGCEEVARCLLKHGADPNAMNDADQTAAMIALERNETRMTRLLTPPGVVVPSIHLAAFLGDRNKVEVFLRDGADVNQPLSDGRTPLHIAAREGHADVLKVLIAHGASLDVRDDDKNTPLFLAASEGHLGAVSLLVSAGADANGYGTLDATSLHFTLSNRYGEIVEFLIANGANIRAQDYWGQTVLHCAAVGLQEEIIDFLIAHGADVSARDQQGRTPLHEAAETPYVRKYDDYFWNGQSDPDRDMNWPSREEAYRLLAGTISRLVRHGADINAKDNEGRTPLHRAVVCDLPEVAEILLANGAQIDSLDNEGGTPLHIAARLHYANTVELLVCWGADVNAKDRDGNTPLDLAQPIRDEALLRLLTPSENAQDRRP